MKRSRPRTDAARCSWRRLVLRLPCAPRGGAIVVEKKRLLVVTGGGDCPGLNAVIRAIVRRALLHYGWEVLGSEDAFNGILQDPERVDPLDLDSVRGILSRGGTILGTTNKGDPFNFPVERPDGKLELRDRSDDVIRWCREHKIDCVVSIGGDGSAKIAQKLFEKGLNVVCVPKTIDNDLDCTDYTFGFLTAVATATDAVDKLHTTGESHHRIMVLEVMGRYAGWIALASGIAGGADHILIPEIPYDLEKVSAGIKKGLRAGRRPYAVVVVAEGAKPLGGEALVTDPGKPGYGMPRLGGIGLRVSEDLQKLTGIEARYTVLGHLQRGGSPVAFDRILGSEFGVHAVDMVAHGKFGQMAAFKTPGMTEVSIAQAIANYKVVELDGAMLHCARGLGIGFGD
ncbi:ATP-dependent 6-phosphofructokinase [bacterium]|nr:ATP-dependent 6-phosphofructokinase [bacterium]